MSGSNDNAGSVGVARTWPLQASLATVAVTPLPADATAGAVATGTPTATAADAGPGTGTGRVTDSKDQATTAPTESTTPAKNTATVGAAPDPVVFPVAAAPTTTTAKTVAPANADAIGQPAGTAGAVGGTVFALLRVIGVILALAWLAKRMPGIAGASNPALNVVGSLALGPRERVVVVAVGDTQLLLATGPNGTRALHTLTEPLPMAASTQTPQFAQLLARHLGRKP